MHSCAMLTRNNNDECTEVGMHGIKKCPTTIYHLKKYRDTGIPQYFATS